MTAPEPIDPALVSAAEHGSLVFDVHGQFHLVLSRELGDWVAWRVDGGDWRALSHLRLPCGADAEAVETFVNERFQSREGPRPGIRRVRSD